MFQLTRNFIQEMLDDPDLDFTDRQTAMFQGMSAYTETLLDEVEDQFDQMTNPGAQPEPEVDDGT